MPDIEHIFYGIDDYCEMLEFVEANLKDFYYFFHEAVISNNASAVDLLSDYHDFCGEDFEAWKNEYK